MMNRFPKLSLRVKDPTVRSPTIRSSNTTATQMCGLGQSHASPFAIGPESVSSYEPRLVVSVGSSLSSTGDLEFGPVLGYGSLHLFPSVTG